MLDSIKSQLASLPTHSGVYQMLDEESCVIYVGKATNIKQRVKQYFTGKHTDYKTMVLVQHIRYIKPIITKNDHEALLLESQLIKQFQPRFNVLLKDDKSYPYIKITTNEPFPRIIITRRKRADGALYFGPYTSYGSSKKLRQLLYDLFPIRDCKQIIDRSSLQKKCIKLDIGQCIGPCIYKDVFEDYQSLIHQCIQLLSGKDTQIIQHLTNQMNELSASQLYEKAAAIRDKITYLQQIQHQRNVDLDTNHHHYFISRSSNDDYHYFIAQHYHHKLFVSQYGSYIEQSSPLIPFIEANFLKLLPTNQKKVMLICDESMAGIIQPIISQLNLDFISIISPTKGIKCDMLKLTELNAKKSLIGLSKSLLQSLLPAPIQQLKETLNLPEPPSIIFGCDISHFYGQQIVGSVVVFIDGKPAPKYYRHFNITSVITGKSNDVKSIKETVLRLFNHYDKLPHLLLIDGGKGQLNAALDAMKELKITQTYCISLAKKNEEIYQANQKQPLRLSNHDTGLNLLRHIRDESHRFAVTFQRTLTNIGNA